VLDPAQDPDRYDASKDVAPSPGPPARLDPAQDPDRFRSPTLPGLLGEGAQEGERDGATWLLGLVSVFAFLILVSVLVSLRT
jgi:hypothetical protein